MLRCRGQSSLGLGLGLGLEDVVSFNVTVEHVAEVEAICSYYRLARSGAFQYTHVTIPLAIKRGLIFRERELTFTFATCYRPSVV